LGWVVPTKYGILPAPVSALPVFIVKSAETSLKLTVAPELAVIVPALLPLPIASVPPLACKVVAEATVNVRMFELPAPPPKIVNVPPEIAKEPFGTESVLTVLDSEEVTVIPLKLMIASSLLVGTPLLLF
jgi:hypothetical protein